MHTDQALLTFDNSFPSGAHQDHCGLTSTQPIGMWMVGPMHGAPFGSPPQQRMAMRTVSPPSYPLIAQTYMPSEHFWGDSDTSDDEHDDDRVDIYVNLPADLIKECK